MDVELMAVAEHLSSDFADLSGTTVARVLADCVEEFPNDGVHFIEQAARARLSVGRSMTARADTTPTTRPV